jgi:hypothetical protein
MKKSSRPRGAGVLLLTVVAIECAACASATINKVLADPSRYRDQEVRLSGDVLDSYSIGNRGVYRISDHTGELWVVADKDVPRKGARVTVSGTIKEGFNASVLGDKIKLPMGLASGLVMIEKEHKAR